eukprot:gb/GEZN01008496.1/.p1 GENE.gb/GEZN01008496.1/~~gb/GEZN01008496.1/.p1  ORF type:complete len:295 (+),score=49.54 gb/GEZN01008496.1/:242-1126(+)
MISHSKKTSATTEEEWVREGRTNQEGKKPEWLACCDLETQSSMVSMVAQAVGAHSEAELELDIATKLQIRPDQVKELFVWINSESWARQDEKEPTEKKKTSVTAKERWVKENGLDDDLSHFPHVGPAALKELKEHDITRAGQIVANWYGECECDFDSLCNWMKAMGINKRHVKQAAASVAEKYPKASAEALANATRTTKKTTIAEWVSSDGLLDDLKLFPGIGPKGEQKLSENSVTRAGQLIEAWFDNCEMNEDIFKEWLKANGVAASHASQCARAVAEKFPRLKPETTLAKTS